MKQQTYNDGVATVYSVENIAEPGNKAEEGLVVKIEKLRYSEEKVGIIRFYNAMQVKMKVDRLLRFPRIDTVTSSDVIKPTDDKEYKILQVQYPKDVYPPSMDLALERIGVDNDTEGS